MLKGALQLGRHVRTLVRVMVVIATTVILLCVRLSLLHGHLPHFSAQDNPASFSDSVLTRGLTYSYLAFFNCR